MGSGEGEARFSRRVTPVAPSHPSFFEEAVMQIEISFPGGKRVDAQFGPHLIRTDQSAEAGGEGSAPEPYSLFLASLGTCAGIFVLSFCQKRGLATEGLR